MSKKTLISHLRNIPDYPMEGVQFKDVTSWFMNPEDMNEIVYSLYEMYKDKGITKVCGVESRGYILELYSLHWIVRDVAEVADKCLFTHIS